MEPTIVATLIIAEFEAGYIMGCLRAMAPDGEKFALEDKLNDAVVRRGGEGNSITIGFTFEEFTLLWGIVGLGGQGLALGYRLQKIIESDEKLVALIYAEFDARAQLARHET